MMKYIENNLLAISTFWFIIAVGKRRVILGTIFIGSKDQ